MEDKEVQVPRATMVRTAELVALSLFKLETAELVERPPRLEPLETAVMVEHIPLRQVTAVTAAQQVLEQMEMEEMAAHLS